MRRGEIYAWMWRALVLSLLSGCCLANTKPSSKDEMKGRVYDHRYDLVYAAVRSVLAATGHPISQDDPNSGILQGDWSEQRYERTQVRAKVRPLGRQTTQVLLLILMEEKGVFGGGWKPADADFSMYDRLFEEIDLQIYREYFREIEQPAREGKPTKTQ